MALDTGPPRRKRESTEGWLSCPCVSSRGSKRDDQGFAKLARGGEASLWRHLERFLENALELEGPPWSPAWDFAWQPCRAVLASGESIEDASSY
jgi:hypothetical protein